MADQYEFKLFNPNPEDVTGWVPVMWAQKKNVKIKFIAPDDWVSKGLKVFRVHPEDKVYFNGADTTAEQAKLDIINDPDLWKDWDVDDDRYNGDPSHKATFTWSTGRSDQNKLTINDKHNGGRVKDSKDIEVDPVFDFILLFHRPDAKGGYEDILVDPRIRNEY